MESRFSQALRESILEGLEKTLGESGMKVILVNIELNRCVDTPGDLHKSLYDVFKDGAFALEKEIVKELSLRLGVPDEERSNLDFAGCVDRAKRLFVESQKKFAGDGKR